MCPPHQFSQFPTSRHLCRPAFLPTWPFMACTPPCTPFCTPPHTSMHLCTPLCTSTHLRTSPCTSAHPCTTFVLHFPGLVTLIGPSILTSDPFGYPGQLSPSATRHNAHPQTSVESSPNSHPRTLSSWVTIAKVALLFITVSPTAGSHTLYYHSMAHGQLIPILSGHTFFCNPWRPVRAQP